MITKEQALEALETAVHFINNVRADLQPDMTLPTLPEGWVYSNCYQCSLGWLVEIWHDNQILIDATGKSPRAAALAAIAKIESEDL